MSNLKAAGTIGGKKIELDFGPVAAVRDFMGYESYAKLSRGLNNLAERKAAITSRKAALEGQLANAQAAQEGRATALLGLALESKLDSDVALNVQAVREEHARLCEVLADYERAEGLGAAELERLKVRLTQAAAKELISQHKKVMKAAAEALGLFARLANLEREIGAALEAGGLDVSALVDGGGPRRPENLLGVGLSDFGTAGIWVERLIEDGIIARDDSNIDGLNVSSNDAAASEKRQAAAAARLDALDALHRKPQGIIESIAAGVAAARKAVGI